MAKFKHGDIFTLQLPNQKYMFGRIMLDIYNQCVKPKLIEPDSPLMFHARSLVVEVYKQVSDQPDFNPSEVLIPGFYLSADPLKSEQWQIVGHQEVNPTELEFPESLARSCGSWCIERGDLSLHVAVDWGEERKDWNVFPTIVSPYALPKICLYYLGLKHLLEPIEPLGIDWWSLGRIDLRYSAIRSEIYKLAGEDENQSYYQITSKYGIEPDIFYQMEL
ncbi:MAG TPA: hypothetical protein DCP31_04200 [Cyanobacteria bacterium UBA8543]|nr:hypothetical protein [Cyanobacteria bacterium UBA8543]